MKKFLDKLQTPGEIRKEEQKRREEEKQETPVDSNHDDDIDDPGPEQLIRGEDAENLNKTRIEFGNGCFMSFEGATTDNNANHDSATCDLNSEENVEELNTDKI